MLAASRVTLVKQMRASCIRNIYALSAPRQHVSQPALAGGPYKRQSLWEGRHISSTRQLRSQPGGISVANTDSGLATGEAEAQQNPWQIKMLFDGECPLCMREVNMLRKRDAGVGKIAFVDIADPSYDPAANAGISFEQAMGEIHAVLPDGKVIKNIDVFKRLYEAVGLGWVYKFTEIEPLRKAADALYGVWAKYRLPITGRPDYETVLRQRSEKTCR